MVYRIPPIAVPEENPFANDALNRADIVNFVAGILSETDGHPLVLAIDSPYGTGKSTFVDMLGKVLVQQNFQTVYFNAWKADHVSDPLIAMVAALDSALPTSATNPASNKMTRVKKVAGILLKRGAAVGVKIATAGLVDVSDDIEDALSDTAVDITTDIVDAFEKEEEAAKCFRTELEKVVATLPAMNKNLTLVFFIDELDRCRPDFAMSLLERIKHMFDVPNIAFVLAVDKKQLEAVTAAVYGEKIDATEYLRKFIDLEFGLPSPPKAKFIKNAIKRAGLDEKFNARGNDKETIVRFMVVLVEMYNMSLRAIERCITRLKLVLAGTIAEQPLDTIHTTLLIVLRSVDKEMFDKIVFRKIGFTEAMDYFYSLAGGKERLEGAEGTAFEAALVVGLCSPDEIRIYRKNEIDIINGEHGSTDERRQKSQHLLNLVDSFANNVFDRNMMARVAATIDIAANVR